jgi:hypothetical protein
MDKHIAAVELKKAHRLINHGPTVLVSAGHEGVDNVMAAAWACALDFSPPKLTVVLDKTAKTRELVERSGTFVIQVPTAAQLQLTHEVRHPKPVQRAGQGGAHWRGVFCDRRPRLAFRHGVLGMGSPASSFRNLTTSRPTTCSSARSLARGPIHASSRTAIGTTKNADPAWRSLSLHRRGHFYAIGDPLSVQGSLP